MVTIALAPAANQRADATSSAKLIEAYAPVARSMASRYRNRGVDQEDLEQVALLALTQAAQRFDPDAGFDFMSYAVPTVRGELRKYFRDFGWMVRPPRRIQELQARIRSADQELSAILGRSPRPTELAAQLDAPLTDVTEALSAEGCFTPTSLEAPIAGHGSGLGDLLGSDDVEMGRAEARIMLGTVLTRLPEQDRLILQLRFYEGKSQNEIGKAIGVTQAQVSRNLARILENMRSLLHPEVSAA